MSADHVFVDTKILVYAHDSKAGVKHRAALGLVKSLWDLPYPPAVSVQVLQELYVSLRKKNAGTAECRTIVEIYFAWDVIEYDLPLLESGISLHERYKLNFWDALVVAGAQRAKASRLGALDRSEGAHVLRG